MRKSVLTAVGLACGFIIGSFAALGAFYAASIVYDLWH